MLKLKKKSLSPLLYTPCICLRRFSCVGAGVLVLWRAYVGQPASGIHAPCLRLLAAVCIRPAAP